MDNYFKENPNRIEYKEILFLFSWLIGSGVSEAALQERETSPSHPDGMLRKRPLFPLERVGF